MKSVNSRMSNWRVKGKEDYDPPNISTSFDTFGDANARAVPKARGMRCEESPTIGTTHPSKEKVKEIALSTSFEKLTINENKTVDNEYTIPWAISKNSTHNEVKSISLQRSAFNMEAEYAKKAINKKVSSENSQLLNNHIPPATSTFNMDEEYIPLRRPHMQTELKTEVPSKQAIKSGRVVDAKSSNYDSEKEIVTLRRPNVKKKVSNKLAPAKVAQNLNSKTDSAAPLQRPMTKKDIEDELAAIQKSCADMQRSCEAKRRELKAFEKKTAKKKTKGVSVGTAKELDANNNEPEVAEVPENCICQRACHGIRCNICQKFMYGRINETCPAHKKVIFLMDVFSCPRCASPKECLSYVHDFK